MSDPRIAIVAHELDVPLGPQAENDGNLEYILDVIAAVDHANEQCGKDLASALRTLERVYLKPTPQGGVLVPLEEQYLDTTEWGLVTYKAVLAMLPGEES